MKHLILCLLCCLWGCSQQAPRESSAFENWMKKDGKVKVLSTTAIINDIVCLVGEERIDALSLIQGEIDPHSYELVKGDDEKFFVAQAVFYNGLGLEHGASLRYQLDHHSQAVAVGQSILDQNPDQIIRINGQLDPHVWMDIALWSQIIDPIVATLSELDPEGRILFEKNGEILRQQMLEKHQQIQAEFQHIPSSLRYLVTSHDAFNYFARAYLSAPDEIGASQWQARFAAPEGLSPDGQLSSSDIQKMISYLCLHHIHVVFAESNVSRDSLKKIVSACKRHSLNVEISKDVLYGDAMGGPDSGADTYLTMIAHNAKVMITAWDKQGETDESTSQCTAR